MAKTFTRFSILSFPENTSRNAEEGKIHVNALSFSGGKAAQPDLYPNDAVIKNILAFSKALRVEQSPVMGIVETVLN